MQCSYYFCKLTMVFVATLLLLKSLRIMFLAIFLPSLSVADQLNILATSWWSLFQSSQVLVAYLVAKRYKLLVNNRIL